MELTKRQLKKVIVEEIKKVVESRKTFYYIKTLKGYVVDLDGKIGYGSYLEKGSSFKTRRKAKRFAKNHDIENFEIRSKKSDDKDLPGHIPGGFSKSI